MITHILKKTVAADKTVAQVCQIVCSIVAGLVMLFGIRRLAHVDLTESQLFQEMTGTLVLAGVFIIVAFQCRCWRNTA